MLPWLAATLLLLVPSQAHAWGFTGHQLIMRRAIDLLPPELKPFYEHFRDELNIRITDADVWRNVPWDDDPNHFINFGVPEYGVAPFTALPREHGAALAKFGVVTLRKYGTLPWREEEMAGSLRRAMDGMNRRYSYAASDTVLFSGLASHYLQDASQPFHTTINYDGALTGQTGLHSRFESELLERFGSRLRLNPAAPTPITNVRDTVFDNLIESYALVDQVLAADRAAIGTKDSYDDEYFERFFVAVQPLLEQQLNRAISRTAGLLIGAWELAGKPAMYTSIPRPIQRVQR